MPAQVPCKPGGEQLSVGQDKRRLSGLLYPQAIGHRAVKCVSGWDFLEALRGQHGS